MSALLLLGLFSLGACGPEHDWPRQCPSPNNDKVHYLHDTWDDRRLCATADIGCPSGTEYLTLRFPDRMQRHDCGCGCYGDMPDDWVPRGGDEPE